MKLSEISEAIGVKKFDGQTFEEILRYLSQLGSGPIRSLGRGAGGAALQIGEDVYKLWLVDSAYEDYVKYCMQHPDNPFLPKFQGKIKTFPAFFTRHIEAPDAVKFVRMEKLEKYSSRYVFKLDVEFTDEDDEDENGHQAYIAFDRILDNVKYFITDSEIPVMERFIKWLSEENRVPYQAEQLSTELILFVNTLHEIYELNHDWDLHHGNYAQRRDGQVVLLDPIANTADLQLNLKFDKLNSRIKLKRELPTDQKKPGVRRT